MRGAVGTVEPPCDLLVIAKALKPHGTTILIADDREPAQAEVRKAAHCHIAQAARPVVHEKRATALAALR